MLHKLELEKDYTDFLEVNEFVGVYYSSHKCGVCNTMKPQVASIFDNNKVKLSEIVVNEHRELAAQQLIMTSPTVVFYENGKELFRESGFIDLQKINRNLGMITS
ncbi:MAG: thioredoxin family protein [Flavobacteriales bacterium]|nr:thioredoxin family protein [Flavobacteriales bacterium]